VPKRLKIKADPVCMELLRIVDWSISVVLSRTPIYKLYTRPTTLMPIALSVLCFVRRSRALDCVLCFVTRRFRSQCPQVAVLHVGSKSFLELTSGHVKSRPSKPRIEHKCSQPLIAHPSNVVLPTFLSCSQQLKPIMMTSVYFRFE
jgi:hypothetical protein